MPQAQPKAVLFLGSAGDERGPAAEAAFNAVAGRLGLPWRARGLNLSEATETDLQGAAVIVAVGAGAAAVLNGARAEEGWPGESIAVPDAKSAVEALTRVRAMCNSSGDTSILGASSARAHGCVTWWR